MNPRLAMRYPALISSIFLALVAVAALGAPAAPAVTPHNSTHVFQKNTYGGLQQWLAKDASDKHLVSAIRARVLAEAERFGKADYGRATPGARYLRGIKAGQLDITYRELPAGAAIDYAGRDAASVDAIHKWLDAEIDAE
ncbi:MAG TPA: hypothetical protein VGM16_02640 [Gammaproteobacteria bacterium]|jgi:hypothetical protein